MHTVFIAYDSPNFRDWLNEVASEWDLTPGVGSFDQVNWATTASFKSGEEATRFASYLIEECEFPEDSITIFEMSVTEVQRLA